MPGNIERSIGLAQWGAETGEPHAMSKDEALAMLQDLARPLPTGKSKTAMCQTLATAAQKHDLPVGFFVRLIQQESGFNPEVVSPAGAQGVAQFMPRVAEEWGLKNPFDPHAALVASARFLRSLYNQFGNWGLAAAAYNGGMGRVQKWIDKRGKLPDETRHYVMTITGVPADKWVNGKPVGAKFSIPARAPCQEIAHLADDRNVVVPLPPSRTQVVVASSPSKATTDVTVTTTKRGTKVAVTKIKIKSESKVAVATRTTKAQKATAASAGFAAARTKGKKATAALAKSKRGKATVASSKSKRGKATAALARSKTAASSKGKRGKASAAARLAKKSPSKSRAKAKVAKKSSGKGRVQLADSGK